MKYDKNIMNTFDIVPNPKNVIEVIPKQHIHTHPIYCDGCGDELVFSDGNVYNFDVSLYDQVVKELNEMGLSIPSNLARELTVFELYFVCENDECENEDTDAYSYFSNGKYFLVDYYSSWEIEMPKEQYKRKYAEYIERQRAAGQLSLFDEVE